MSEKNWNQILAYLVRTGRADLRIDGRTVDSILEESVSQPTSRNSAEIKEQLVMAGQDRAIEKTSHSVRLHPGLPVGRFVQSIRESAGLTTEEVALRLRKDVNDLQRFERGDIPPERIPVRDFADIMQLFRIKVGDLAPMLASSSAVAATKKNFRVAARSHGGKRTDTRTADVEKALDIFARTRMVAAKPPSGEVKKFLERLRDELRQRNCAELLEE